MKKIDYTNFLLTEYQKCYDLFSLHYNASANLFKLYFIITGGIITIIGYLSEDNKLGIDIFNLSNSINNILLLISIIFFIKFMVIVEHKIKLVFYVRTLNSIRKYFYDNISEKKQKYLLLPTDINVPKYFSLFRDFFWEILFIGLMNSIIISLSIYNYFFKNCSILFFFLIIVLFTLFHIIIFWFRGKMQEKK